MIRLVRSDHVIFIGSPRLSSLNEMLERKLFFSDIPLYDVTRELVLYNQQRLAEIEIRSVGSGGQGQGGTGVGVRCMTSPGNSCS